MTFNRQGGKKPTGRGVSNPDYGSGEGPRPGDVGNYYRLTAQTYRSILKVRQAIEAEATFISQMDKPDTAKEFVKLIAMCRGLHQQLEDALHIARSSGSFRKRPGFSAAVDVWVKAGVKLQVAINSLSVAGSIAGSGTVSEQRKLAVQQKQLATASNSIQSIADQIQMQMNDLPTRPATTSRGYYEY